MRLIILYIFLFTFSQVYGQKYNSPLLKAKALISAGKSDEILQTLTYDANQNNIEILTLIGYTQFIKGNIHDALHIYLKCDSISKNSSSLEIAKCFAVLNDPEKSTFWLTRYLQKIDKLSEYEIITDTIFNKISNSNAWYKLWKQEWYSASDIEKSTIKSFINRKNYNEALSQLENSQKVILPKADFFYFEAIIFNGLEQYPAALKSINNAIESNKQAENYYIEQGIILKNLEKYNDLTTCFSKLIEINPNEPEYYLKRAEAARLSGNFTLARTDLELYLNLIPESPLALFNLGKIEAIQKNYAKAIGYYSELIDIEKGNADYYTEKGELEFVIKKYEMAEADLSMALDINPNLEKANLLKGKIRLHFSDKITACFYLQKAAEKGNLEAKKIINENCGE
jgi:tetratricopeptide (TPR) repeat protein